MALVMALTVQLEVLNPSGLHARPAAEFVRCAMGFKSTTVVLHKDGAEYAATSILEVLMANLDQGAKFTLAADGPDEEEAIQRLSALLVRFRDEEKVG